MELNELRINNLVYANKAICRIKAITETDVLLKNKDYSSIELRYITPIMLNEEILINSCGFKESQIEYGKHKLFYIPSSEPSLGFRLLERGFLDFSFLPNTVSIVHLHQLQNLYFDVTGEELNINIENIRL